MSQSQINLDTSYIVSANEDQSGASIVVNVLTESPSNQSMTMTETGQNPIPVHMVTNGSMSYPYLSSNGVNMQQQQQHMTSLQTSNHQAESHNMDHQVVIETVEMPSAQLGEVDQKLASSTEEDPFLKNTSGVGWPKQAVLKLIALHKEHQHLFDDSQFKKKSIWEMISRKMKEENMIYSWSQAENKWKSLTKRFRDTVDFNARSNNVVHHSCPFYEELSDAYPYVSSKSSFEEPIPLALIQTGTKRPLETKLQLSQADLAVLTKKKKYLNPGVANTKSAQTSPGMGSPVSVKGVELTTLLRSIHEDRKRQDKLKMDKLESMHKEKMSLFKQFLDVLKDIKSKGSSTG